MSCLKTRFRLNAGQTNVSDLQGVIWSTVGTFGRLAPQSRWDQDERIMEIYIRSFRLNPSWVKKHRPQPVILPSNIIKLLGIQDI